jgi:hypothetical protein
VAVLDPDVNQDEEAVQFRDSHPGESALPAVEGGLVRPESAVDLDDGHAVPGPGTERKRTAHRWTLS